MSFSYNPSDLSTSEKDQVRFLIGDVDSSNPILQDEEIDFAIDSQSNVYYAAAECAIAIAARYAPDVNVTIDGMSVQNQDKMKKYQAIANNLRMRATSNPKFAPAPIITGISISDMQSVDQNSDRPASAFEIGEFDNPPQLNPMVPPYIYP